MALYNKDEIFQKAKESVNKYKLIFIEEIVSFLPISKATFYEYFKIDSDELNELKSLIEDNKVSIKAALRKKWYDSDNATLQMALYKLSSSPEEHKRLSQTYTDHTTDGEKLNNLPPKIEVYNIGPKLNESENEIDL